MLRFIRTRSCSPVSVGEVNVNWPGISPTAASASSNSPAAWANHRTADRASGSSDAIASVMSSSVMATPGSRSSWRLVPPRNSMSYVASVRTVDSVTNTAIPATAADTETGQKYRLNASQSTDGRPMSRRIEKSLSMPQAIRLLKISRVTNRDVNMLVEMPIPSTMAKPLISSLPTKPRMMQMISVVRLASMIVEKALS